MPTKDAPVDKSLRAIQDFETMRTVRAVNSGKIKQSDLTETDIKHITQMATLEGMKDDFSIESALKFYSTPRIKKETEFKKELNAD